MHVIGNNRHNYGAVLMVLTISLQAPNSLRAQSDLPKTGGYMNVLAGWAIGGSSTGFLGMAAGGARLHRWGLGLASGIDNDGVTSVPVLADIRFALRSVQKHTLDVFSQQGWNVVTMSKEAFVQTTYSGGPFWNGGIAWKLCSTSAATGVWLSAGISYRQYRYERPYYFLVPTPSFPTDPVSPAVNTLKEWRGVLALGWGWR